MNCDLTLLQRAVSKGDPENVKLLISQGADVNVNTPTPVLIMAIRGRHAEIVVELVQAGANVNARDGLETRHEPALVIAAKGMTSTHEIITQILIDAGAELDAYDGDGCTALSRAVDKQVMGNFRSLVRAGANVDLAEIIDMAAERHNKELLVFLITAGAEVCPVLTPERDETPLETSIHCVLERWWDRPATLECVEILLLGGADPGPVTTPPLALISIPYPPTFVMLFIPSISLP